MEVTARHLNEVEAVQHVHLTVPSTVEIDRTSPVIDPKARYWSRIAIFAYLTLHSTPPLRGGGIPVGILPICHKVWYGITKMVWLPDGEKKFKDMSTPLAHANQLPLPRL